MPKGDWITHIEVRRKNGQRIVCGIMIFTDKGRKIEFQGRHCADEIKVFGNPN